MMKFKTVLAIFFLCTYSLLSQERLTSYDNGGTNLNNRLETIEGRHFLLQTDQNDVMHTYELVSEENKIHLHSKKIPGMYSNLYPFRILHNSNITYGIGGIFYDYNFIDNVTDSIMLPSGLTYQMHRTSLTGQHLLTLENEDENQFSYVYQNGEDGILLGDKIYLEIYDSYALEGIYDGQAYSHFILHNYQEGTTDTISNNIIISHRPIQVGDMFYYVDDVGQVCEFSSVSKEHRKLRDLIVDPNSTARVYLLEQENRLYIGYSNFSFIVYDLLTEEVIDTYTNLHDDVTSSFKVINI